MEFQKNILRSNNSQQQESFNQQFSHPPTTQKWRKNKNTGLSVFIAKTFQILESNQYSDIITWNQQGTNFTIVDVEKFQAQILPIYFRHRNFSSFVRQLNMYDFHKIRNQKNLSMFQHKEFRRNSKQSLVKIKRKGCTTKKDIRQSIKRQELQYPFQQKIEPRQIQNKNIYMEIYDQKQKKVKNIEQEKDQQDLSHQLSLKDLKQSQSNVRNSRISFKSTKANNKNLTEVSINHFDENQNSKLESKQKLSIPSSFNININYNLRKEAQENSSKKELIQEFVSTVPQILYSQQEIQEKIKELKQNPKYKCLNCKEQLRKIYKKLKNRKIFNEKQNQLQDLSIQQEIAVENMDKNLRMREWQKNKSEREEQGQNVSSVHIPMMALMPTQKFLPNRSISLIGSLAYLNYGQDFDALMHGFH